jgi:hypothetical protein
MQKQSFEDCISEYNDSELINFHANINALFLCCSEDFHLLPLLMKVHFTLSNRNTPIIKKYLDGVDKMLNVPESYKYAKH